MDIFTFPRGCCGEWQAERIKRTTRPHDDCRASTLQGLIVLMSSNMQFSTGQAIKHWHSGIWPLHSFEGNRQFVRVTHGFLTDWCVEHHKLVFHIEIDSHWIVCPLRVINLFFNYLVNSDHHHITLLITSPLIVLAFSLQCQVCDLQGIEWRKGGV